MLRCLFVLFVFLLSVSFVVGHQPRLVSEGLIVVENPEVSQAFYGELNGEPVFYLVASDRPFTLYVGVLVPDIEGIDKDVSAEITLDLGEHAHVEEGGEQVAVLNASSVDWAWYYEEFAGDSYYRGPDFKREVGAGVYTIRVFSPDNQGKYVLVVGDEEVFTFTDMVDTVFSLPKLKKDFFGKSPFTAFFNLIGVFLVAFLLVACGVGFLLFRLFRRLMRR